MVNAEREATILVYVDGGGAHARLIGPVNRETARQFQQRLEAVSAGACSTLFLDLGAAEYVDSDGIRWLQRLKADLDDRAIELRLGLREGSRADRTLRLLQLDRAFTIDRYPLDSGAAVH